ncbi:uncharacterized protein LOC106511726 [Austrofundulus limnaeus]|uniref:Uncharacterized protein LOC106511726 n=1 Tax=Austrofundulus limnaeus TaxID=52670 RepID=A0A2I4AKD1_AUSLI|nr:PREDICTED: uncharacterized protein LOC106511726 [Austrofundulus limnaeus]
MAPYDANRHYLLCPLCKKTHAMLPKHLRRACMKKASDDEVMSVVKKAKEDAHEILQSGRMFSFDVIRGISDDPSTMRRLIKELERRHMVVTDIPSNFESSSVIPQTVQPPPTAADVQMTEPDEVESVSSGETFQCETQQGWQTENRQLMMQKGLYQKHSRDHKLLKEYATFLHKDKGLDNYRQDVDNVARYLHYMDPSGPSLRFVMQPRDKTKQYLRDLQEAKLKKRTQVNYLKSLRRFLYFHTYDADLKQEDPVLHAHCVDFLDFLKLQQTKCSKQVSKEITRKRHEILTTTAEITTPDTLAVLKLAKKDFLTVIGKVFPEESSLQMSEIMHVVYYLQAIIILKHAQRVGVAKSMTVEEWMARKPVKEHCVVGVKEHKTAAQEVAMFALTQEEEMWFDIYYTRIRPQILRSKGCKEDLDQEKFFLSSRGTPIYNPSNDLARLHTKYGIKPVSSQEARRLTETAMKTRVDVDKALVADYLTHSNATAEKHYRMKTPANILTARLILDSVQAGSSNDSEQETPCDEARASTSGSTQMDVHAAFDKLLQDHPISLDGEVPSKAARTAISEKHQRQLYERWLKAQMKLRVQHVLDQFSRRLPTEARVQAWITSKGWKSNIPRASMIVQDWKPTGSLEDAVRSDRVVKCIKSQKWTGLAFSEIEGKNRGVVTTRDFLPGEVVCDYHGKLVSHRKGEEIHRDIQLSESGYMFFFKNKGKALCIDAHEEHCECHPEKLTFGRLINHSRKHPNIKPRLYIFTSDGVEKEVILFIASQKIRVNEELLFDYGVNRKSYCGEGLDLDWL